MNVWSYRITQYLFSCFKVSLGLNKRPNNLRMMLFFCSHMNERIVLSVGNTVCALL